jgi:hypothetical protein
LLGKLQGLGELDLGDALRLTQFGDACAEPLEEGSLIGADSHRLNL